MQLSKDNFVIDDAGYILGRFIPSNHNPLVQRVNGYQCHVCHALIRPCDIQTHKYLCHAIGKGSVTSTFAGFVPYTNNAPRRTLNTMYIGKLAKLLK